MHKINRLSFFLLLFAWASCKNQSDNGGAPEYFFISSTSGLDRENELIVNMDSVFVHRFVLKAPYSHYNSLLSDSLRSDASQAPENSNPFLMLRYAVIDSAKEDIFISGLNVHLYKLYDSIPGDALPIHGVRTGDLNASVLGTDAAQNFPVKDTIKIKGGTGSPSIFMIADYDLKDHLDDATFLLRTQMTIKYKNAYNLIDLYDTIVQHDRW